MSFEKENQNKKIEQQNGIFFRYDKKNDCFICSQGKELPFIQKNQKRRRHLYTERPCIRNTWVLETNEIRIRHHLKSDAKLIH